MLRFLNIAVLTLLVGTAAWAYQTKYETIFYAEQVKKLESTVEKEKDQIAILKAEWQLMNRPTRLDVLAQRYLEMKPLKSTQVARAQDIPERKAVGDQIGAKLDSLGITGSISSPDSGRNDSGRHDSGRPAGGRSPGR